MSKEKIIDVDDNGKVVGSEEEKKEEKKKEKNPFKKLKRKVKHAAHSQKVKKIGKRITIAVGAAAALGFAAYEIFEVFCGGGKTSASKKDVESSEESVSGNDENTEGNETTD